MRINFDNKKKYIIIFILFLTIVSLTIPCFTEKHTEDDVDSPLIDTMVHYSVVSHTLMGDKGLSNKIFSMSNRARYNLFSQWRFKINKECIYNKDLYDHVHELHKKGLNLLKEEDIDKFKERISEFYDGCSQDYIHRNWDEINKTIINTYKRNKKAKCPYCLFYKLFY